MVTSYRVLPEALTLRCSVKKVVLRNFAKLIRKHLCQSLFFNKVSTLLKKETLAQVFSCELCDTSKNIFSYRTPPVAVSVLHRVHSDRFFFRVLSYWVILVSFRVLSYRVLFRVLCDTVLFRVLFGVLSCRVLVRFSFFINIMRCFFGKMLMLWNEKDKKQWNKTEKDRKKHGKRK